jgi:hypothetical protein
MTNANRPPSFVIRHLITSSFAMYYIDPHIHMVSRTTDDYETLAKMGCVAVSEPAFWAGYDRGSAAGFRDYFEQLTSFEPKRAGCASTRRRRRTFPWPAKSLP